MSKSKKQQRLEIIRSEIQSLRAEYLSEGYEPSREELVQDLKDMVDYINMKYTTFVDQPLTESEIELMRVKLDIE